MVTGIFLFFQLEAFYSIFTTEQQDHVKSVEYLRNNFRPPQDLYSRKIFKSAVKDAWQKDLTEVIGGPHGTEASRGRPHSSHIILGPFLGWSFSLDLSLAWDCGRFVGITVFSVTFLENQSKAPAVTAVSTWTAQTLVVWCRALSLLLTSPFPIIKLACRDGLQG